MRPPRPPRHSAPMGPTEPAAGVIVARPPMAPVTMPSTDALPVSLMSCSAHTIAAVAAEICVARQAKAASAPATTAEPPLKPNQPTHSMPVPTTVSMRLPAIRRLSLRGPSTFEATSAPMPAVMWTTMPPAKSMTPRSAKKAPAPPQTMWHAGKYTANTQRAQYHITALNFMRSTRLPTIRAGVMMAKVIWYSAQSASGMVPFTEAMVMPRKPTLSRPPMKLWKPATPSCMPTPEKERE
mmetsp:Transcript_16339/g.42209  ORF Transcript_16339/g.42209 Transcript_16339/m.42209 type:complete len:239 (-) Transcript_16339:289-1005(-)